jgi:hypothetical protein
VVTSALTCCAPAFIKAKKLKEERNRSKALAYLLGNGWYRGVAVDEFAIVCWQNLELPLWIITAHYLVVDVGVAGRRVDCPTLLHSSGCKCNS